MKQTSAIILIIASVVLLMFACVSNQPATSTQSPTSTARKNIKHISPSDLKELCDFNGGVYSPPSAGGVYYCLLPDGGLIACGGTMGCTYDARQSGKPPPRGIKELMR
jgi:hypothetical protein